MKNEGTPIAKLTGIDFYIYLYRLEQQRSYEHLAGCDPNTIGLGYVGNEINAREGMQRIFECAQWLHNNLEPLKQQYGRKFPDAAQYASFDYIGKDMCIVLAGKMMDEYHGRAWIETNLRDKTGTIEERIAYLKSLPGEEKLLRESGDLIRRPNHKVIVSLSDEMISFLGQIQGGDECQFLL